MTIIRQLVNIDHKKLIKLYTKCKILSMIRKGDSLSQIQSKTGLSYITIQNAINELESMGIIETRVITTDKGKIREIIYISKYHSEHAKTLLDNFEKLGTLLEYSRDQIKKNQKNRNGKVVKLDKFFKY